MMWYNNSVRGGGEMMRNPVGFGKENEMKCVTKSTNTEFQAIMARRIGEENFVMVQRMKKDGKWGGPDDGEKVLQGDGSGCG